MIKLIPYRLKERSFFLVESLDEYTCKRRTTTSYIIMGNDDKELHGMFLPPDYKQYLFQQY
jgi:hypothetical protein